jgi:hypothetical protein
MPAFAPPRLPAPAGPPSSPAPGRRVGGGGRRRAGAFGQARIPLLLLGWLLGLGPQPAWASLGVVLHVARAGDTPESLATTYYGNRARALFIREANHLRPSQRLRAGVQVKIPTAFKVKVRRGDTLERLARRYLDDSRRAHFLGEWNGVKPGERLRDGVELKVPFHLTHLASAPESLATLALAFYGDAGQGKLLAAYNFRQAPVLARGESLVVPVPHVRVRAMWLASTRSPARAPHKAEAPSSPSSSEAQAREEELAHRVGERLRQAERAWQEGSYEDVVDLLSRLLADEDPSEAQLVAIHRLLGFAYVALGHQEPAKNEFRPVLERDPQAALDDATVSPKIRAVFEQARAER